MQHFKVVVFAVVVASCVFQGEGLPAGGGKTASGTSTTIGGGITIEDDGTVKGLGPGTKFTADSLAGPLSVVTLDTIQKAINLDLHRRLKNVDIAQVFSDLIVAQSRLPDSGEINYETAIVFLQMFDTVPAEVISTLKTVCFFVMKVKQAKDNNKVFEFKKQFPEAITNFGGKFSRQAELMWITISPVIYEAVKGDKIAAKTVVDFATDGGAALQGLKKQDNLITRAVDLIVQFADLIKAKASK